MDQKDTTSGDPFGDPNSIDDLAGMYLAAVSSILSSLSDADGRNAGFSSDIMYLLAQAQVRWLTSAVRYWSQIATIVGTQGTDAAEALKPSQAEISPDTQRLILLDKARAALREISDLSLSEAKLLQRDLMKIEADLRDTLGGDAMKRDGPHRYANSKL